MLRLASTSFALSVVLLTCIASAEQPANKAVLSHTRYNGALKGARHSALSFDNGLLALPMPSSVDDWLGGFGLWSNADNWDNGVPDGTSDVTIYSGGNDIVTLDVRAAINSLTLGGAPDGYTSELTDGGAARFLSISNALNVGQQGILYFTGNGSYVSAGSIVNNGAVTIGTGTTLNLTNQPGGVTDVPAGASWTISGNFAAGGVANTGFANLASIEGAVTFENGQSQTIGRTLTVASGGSLNVIYGTSLNISDGLTNNGSVSTVSMFGGGNMLNISGNLTNNPGARFTLYNSGDVANVATMDNSGAIYVAKGATLNLTDELVGITDAVATSIYNIYGAFNVIFNGAFANLTNVEGQVNLYGQNDNIFPQLGPLTIASGGSFTVNSGSTVWINEDVTNSGRLTTGSGYGVGGNQLNIIGTLTNSGSFFVSGPGDSAALNGLNNSGVVAVGNGSALQINGNVSNSGLLATGGNGPYAGSKVNITGNLINTGGTLSLGGSGDIVTISGLTNSGTVAVNGGGTLQINGAVNNSGLLAASNLSNDNGGDTLNIAGTLTNQASAQLDLYRLDVANLGGLNNEAGGFIGVFGGSSLTVNSDVTNPGWIFTGGSSDAGGNTVNFAGSLTNSGRLVLQSAGDLVTISNGMTNGSAGFVDLERGSVLTVIGDVMNSGFLGTDNYGYSGGNTVNITGNLTNKGTFELNGAGDMATIGSLTNSALVDVDGGSTLTIKGNVTNSGSLHTSYNGTGSNTLNVNGNVTNSGSLRTGNFGKAGNELNISGTLTNNGYFSVASGDVANAGMLVNNGDTVVTPGATLNLTNQPNGITDVVAGSEFDLYGTFTAGVNAGVANLNSVEGIVNLYGENFTVTPSSGTVTISGTGQLALLYNSYNGLGTVLTINGNFDNSGSFFTGIEGNNKLTVGGTMTNDGIFLVQGPGDVANVGTFANNGYTLIDAGATLNLTHQPNGITDVVAGSRFDLYGTFTAGGNPGFANLNSLEGTLYLEGQSFTDTPGSGTLTISGPGFLTTAALTINGNVNNSGEIYIGYSSGDMLTINGTLTNSGTFELDSNSIAMIGNGLANTGKVKVVNGSTLNITGDVTNSGTMSTSSDQSGGNTLSIMGNLTNDGFFGFLGPGDKGSVSGNVTNDSTGLFGVAYGAMGTIGGNLTNAFEGIVDVEIGSTLQIGGDVNNSGSIGTNFVYGLGGNNTLNITGKLTNQASGQFILKGPTDMATLGALDNSGLVEVENRSTLQINGDLNNFVTGTVQVDSSTLQVNGNLNNFGTLIIDPSTLTVTGTLTNNVGSTFSLAAGDILNAGSVNNLGSFTLPGGTQQKVTVHFSQKKRQRNARIQI